MPLNALRCGLGGLGLLIHPFDCSLICLFVRIVRPFNCCRVQLKSGTRAVKGVANKHVPAKETLPITCSQWLSKNTKIAMQKRKPSQDSQTTAAAATFAFVFTNEVQQPSPIIVANWLGCIPNVYWVNVSLLAPVPNARIPAGASQLARQLTCSRSYVKTSKNVAAGYNRLSTTRSQFNIGFKYYTLQNSFWFDF